MSGQKIYTDLQYFYLMFDGHFIYKIDFAMTERLATIIVYLDSFYLVL